MTNIVIVGNHSPGHAAVSLERAFVAAGHSVLSIDTGNVISAPLGSLDWFSMKRSRQASPSTQRRIAELVGAATGWGGADMLIACKTIAFDQNIFLQAPVPYKVHVSWDDMSSAVNTSSQYLNSEHEWDLLVTTKRHNIREMQDRGARNVIFLWSPYEREDFRSITPWLNRPFYLGFIGASRPDRVNLPKVMAQHFPGSSIVYGPRWRRAYPVPPRGVEIRGPVTGAALTAAANEFQVGLVLLNSHNRDTHTTRTFETAAAGQVVLAERTPEHESLFKDGEEAFFFSTLKEAMTLAAELRSDPVRLQNVAQGGMKRVEVGGFTYATWVTAIEGARRRSLGEFR